MPNVTNPYPITPTEVNNITIGKLDLVAYPNPTHSALNIETNILLDNAELIVFNSLGQEQLRIKNINGKQIKIATTELRHGLHFFSISNNTTKFIGKFIVD